MVPYFFEFITSLMGVYVCSVEETTKQSKMNVVRILVRTKYSLVLNETFNVEINNNVFGVKILEDSQRLMWITIPKFKKSGRILNGLGEWEEEADEVDTKSYFVRGTISISIKEDIGNEENIKVLFIENKDDNYKIEIQKKSSYKDSNQSKGDQKEEAIDRNKSQGIVETKKGPIRNSADQNWCKIDVMCWEEWRLMISKTKV